MKHEKLSDALSQISDKHLAEASHTQKRKFPRWLGVVAAVLVLAILVGTVSWPPLSPNDDITLSGGDTAPSDTAPPDTAPPLSFDPFEGTLTPVEIKPSDSAYLLSAPAYPNMAPYSTRIDGYNKWWESQQTIHHTELGYADHLTNYFKQITSATLSSGEGNTVFSPLNIYMALAMLAQTSDGTSRQQILELLGAENIEVLRSQAEQVWRAHYNNDGMSTSILGSSLWLDENVRYNEETIKTLAESYYASIFQGEIGSPELNATLQEWLNENTGNLLQEQANNVKLSPEVLLALATTIYYQVQWQNEFYEQYNTTRLFHSITGDKIVTFMNQELLYGPYYWGEDYGAVGLRLKNGDRMWLILPDEGKTPADLLSSGHAMDMILCKSEYPNHKSIIVNLSLPKFDISAELEIKKPLVSLGVTDVFDDVYADFSPILPNDTAYVSSIRHAARVAVDEDGITAAAFTVILTAGAAIPPTEKIDFVLDRPFLFVIESSDGLPIFAGVVNDP